MAYSIFKFHMKNQLFTNYCDIRVNQAGYDIRHPMIATVNSTYFLDSAGISYIPHS